MPNQIRRMLLKGVIAAPTALAASPVAVSVREFGARGDGRSDDTAAFQRALDAGHALFVPPGEYSVGDLRLRSGSSLSGVGRQCALNQRSGSRYLFSADPGAKHSYELDEGLRRIEFNDLRMTGLVQTTGFMEHSHLLNLNGVREVRVTSCEFSSFQGDAIYIGSGNNAGQRRHNKDVEINSCTFHGGVKNNRNAISVIDCTGLRVIRCKFFSCSRRGMPGAIDIEPNAYPFHRIQDIQILDNLFRDAGGSVGNICLVLTLAGYSLPVGRVEISHNRVDGSSSSVGIALRCLGTTRNPSPMGPLIVSKNLVLNTTHPMIISGIRNARILKNRFHKSVDPLLLSLPRNGEVEDVSFLDNEFIDIGSSSARTIKIRDASAILFRGNRFTNAGRSADPYAAIDAQPHLPMVIED